MKTAAAAPRPAARPATADHAAYRRALAQFATGVTIITATAPDGSPAGLTVNSFASVSLDPPLVLWSLALHTDSVTVFRRGTRFLIHVLGVDAIDLAQRFATPGIDRFAGIDWAMDDGLPRLAGAHVAWFACGLRAQHEEGDHVILVGRVESFAVPGGTPLVFHDRRWVTHLTEAPLPRGLQTPTS